MQLNKLNRVYRGSMEYHIAKSGPSVDSVNCAKMSALIKGHTHLSIAHTSPHQMHGTYGMHGCMVCKPVWYACLDGIVWYACLFGSACP